MRRIEMKGFLAAIALLVVIHGSTAHAAVPGTMNFTARLSDTNGPIDGNASMYFAIFDGATGGTAVWTENHPVVTASQGLIYLTLGDTTPLDGTVFTGGTKYLEVTVNGTVLGPRLALEAVPYAVHAGTSDTAASTPWTGITGTIFGGTGTATTAARSDHDHDAVYQKKLTGVPCTAGMYVTNVGSDGTVTCTAAPARTAYYQLTSAATTITAGSFQGIVSPGCNGNDVPITGGCYSNSEATVLVGASYPNFTAGGATWYCGLKNTDTSTHTGTAMVVCVPHP
jgi:hypothetical protein